MSEDDWVHYVARGRSNYYVVVLHRVFEFPRDTVFIKLCVTVHRMRLCMRVYSCTKVVLP